MAVISPIQVPLSKLYDIDHMSVKCSLENTSLNFPSVIETLKIE